MFNKPTIMTALAIALTGSVALAQAPAQPAMYTADHIRGARYCEILVVNGSLNNLTAAVYNTIGCNACPTAQWNAIDPDKLKKELSARAIVMNGPRYFLMDKIGQTNAAPPTVTLGGLAMKKRATVPVSIRNAMAGKSRPYEETTVKRSTEYVFNKGSRVYELVSPDHTYIMQSYAQIVLPGLTETALNTLQTRLKLPSGWRYQTRLLTADLILKTIEGGEGHVIQDDLLNTYQRR
jgi:haloalkane dehalogenase